MEMTRRELILWLAIIAAGFLAGFIGGYNVAVYQQKKAVHERDTVTKVVPVWKDFPDPVKTAQIGLIAVPLYRFIPEKETVVETAFVHDTTEKIKYVYLPREQKYYVEDEGRLRLWVSGYDPSLDRWELDRLETTITETIYPASKHWGLDLFTGFGLLNVQAGLELRYEPGRWGFGLLGGYGVNFIDGKLVPAPFIGGRAKLNIISW